MPNKGGFKNRGQATHGGQMGHGGGSRREGQDGEIGQHTDTTPNSTDRNGFNRGRSESSPGHMKRAAGARSARDFAPGNLRHADRVTVPPETTSDEMRGDRKD